MDSSRALRVLVAAALWSLACAGAVGMPARHRPTSEACAGAPVAGASRAPQADKPDDRDCAADADCTGGVNGRCVGGGHEIRHCSYDRCFADADCGDGHVCQCDGEGNYCVSANCRTDADCGGRGCSPTQGESCGNMGGVAGYYCHTDRDQCSSDEACRKDDQQGLCVFETAAGRWSCNYSFCVG